MGLIRDIFEEKVKIYEGTDKERYTSWQELLKAQGIKTQAFKVNQKVPKCDGNCASCMKMEENPDKPEGFDYSIIGRGCSDDLLTPAGPEDVFAIYVKKSEKRRAEEILGLLPTA